MDAFWNGVGGFFAAAAVCVVLWGAWWLIREYVLSYGSERFHRGRIQGYYEGRQHERDKIEIPRHFTPEPLKMDAD